MNKSNQHSPSPHPDLLPRSPTLPLTHSGLDPITLDVLWSRLLSVVDEQQTALIRTAFSTVVRESQDLACGVFDAHGNMLAQSTTGTPGHINAMATGVRHFLKAYPPETLRPGDVLLTNDPWLTAGQINDITVVTPVFAPTRSPGSPARNPSPTPPLPPSPTPEPVAYFANTCHAADIGGRLLSAEAREVYEEGLRLPIMKLFEAGEPNQALLGLIRANVRTPDEVVGDLFAQAACNDVGARSLLACMEEFNLDDLEALSAAIIERSESAMRQAIRALPDGQYRYVAWSDGYDEPVRIQVLVRIAGDEVWLDFDGSSPQSRHGINVVFNYTHAYASFALKAAISPDVPHNEGSFRPVHVSAPPGSILNAMEPAAVGARHVVGHLLPSAIFGALAQAAPERVIAGSADSLWISVWRGRDLGEQPFTFVLFQCGGAGARPDRDGLSTTGFPSGVAGVPAEVIETLSPLVLERRELRTDSGGPGRQRGGLGQSTELTCRTTAPWACTTMLDRLRFPAQGLFGGQPGATGLLCRTLAEDLPAKQQVNLEPADRVLLALPGGGGWGDPFERPVESVLADVVNGYVSLDAAARDFGVVIHCTAAPDERVRLPEQYVLDQVATAELRQVRR